MFWECEQCEQWEQLWEFIQIKYNVTVSYELVILAEKKMSNLIT